jgi:protein phosphatase methylesterase 1
MDTASFTTPSFTTPASSISFSLFTTHGESPSLLLLCFHGVNHASASFQPLISLLSPHLPSCVFAAPDMCGHGSTPMRATLTLDSFAADAREVLTACCERFPTVQRVFLLGHSFGGVIAVTLAAEWAKYPLPELGGVIVEDFIEAAALASLDHTTSVLKSLPRSFPSLESVINYQLSSGNLEDRTAARLTMPPCLTFSDEGVTWRAQEFLDRCPPLLVDWFSSTTAKFLSLGPPKALFVCDVERVSLDKNLFMAQMQGRLQVTGIQTVCHTMHESAPQAVATAVLSFMQRWRK